MPIHPWQQNYGTKEYLMYNSEVWLFIKCPLNRVILHMYTEVVTLSFTATSQHSVPFTEQKFHKLEALLETFMKTQLPQLQCLVRRNFQKQSCQLCKNIIVNFAIV